MKRAIILGLAGLLLFGGCVTVKRSPFDNPKPQGFAISQNLEIVSLGSLHLYLVGVVDTNILSSGFMISASGKIVYIDPVLVKEVVPADFIFITHDHPDHFSIRDIRKIATEKTIVICPETMKDQLTGLNVRGVSPGDNLHLGTFTCEVVFAYNLKADGFGALPHPRTNAGYIFNFEGTRLYHTSDTDLIPEMKEYSNIDVILLPTPENGAGLTMNMDEAATYINELKPRFVVPMHYELGRNTAPKFKALIHSGISVIILE